MKRMFDNLCQLKICMDHFEDILEMIVYTLTAFNDNKYPFSLFRQERIFFIKSQQRNGFNPEFRTDEMFHFIVHQFSETEQQLPVLDCFKQIDAVLQVPIEGDLHSVFNSTLAKEGPSLHKKPTVKNITAGNFTTVQQRT